MSRPSGAAIVQAPVAGLAVAAWLGFASVAAAAPASPQRADPVPTARAGRASRYLPLGHWAYRYIDLLVARGRLAGLQPLVQPYRRIDVAGAIMSSEAEDDAAPAERAWLDLLRAELEPELQTLADPSGQPRSRASGLFSLGSWAVSDTHRDLLRPEGKSTLLPFLEFDVAAEFPNVVAALRFRWDEWFLNDPQFPDGIVVEEHPRFLGSLDFAGRAEDGYFELQIPHFRLFVGRTYRNWGLPGTGGLLVSGYPYSYDQVGYRVGTSRLSVTGFVAQLDEFPNSVKRWFSAHRFDWRVRENLVLAVAEAVTYGGENRSFDFRLANPISIWLVGGFGKDFADAPNTSNNLTELSFWWRPWRGLVSYLSLMLDELPGGGTPLEHAAAFGLQLPNVAPRLALRLDYSQVATLTYRTSRDFERYAFRNLGLGRDLSDHDLISVRLDWLPRARVILSPQLQLLRRGEGDFRDPWPSGVSEDGPALFTGEVETTLRLALGGQWRPGRRGWLEWDLGQNFVWDAGHEPGRNLSRFSGRLRVNLGTGAGGEL